MNIKIGNYKRVDGEWGINGIPVSTDSFTALGEAVDLLENAVNMQWRGRKDARAFLDRLRLEEPKSYSPDEHQARCHLCGNYRHPVATCVCEKLHTILEGAIEWTCPKCGNVGAVRHECEKTTREKVDEALCSECYRNSDLFRILADAVDELK